MAPVSKILISALTLLLVSPALSAPVNSNALSARQLAGVGAASDSIFTDTDNGVGYGVENAEDNTANLISGTKGSTGTGGTGTGTGSGSSPPPPPPPPPHMIRQLDKVANGAAAGGNVAGNAVQTYGDSVDGAGTSGATNAGAAVGGAEESTLEQAGSAVP